MPSSSTPSTSPIGAGRSASSPRSSPAIGSRATKSSSSATTPSPSSPRRRGWGFQMPRSCGPVWSPPPASRRASEILPSCVRWSRTVVLFVATACARPDASPNDWRVTGGEPGNSRYSRLDQINRGNVARLRVAWTHHTDDMPPSGHSEIQATPIVVDGVLYTTTPVLAAIALRADSGTLIWRFDPFANRPRESHVNRGVAYWADDRARRVFFTAGRRLYALDAGTGRPVPG